MDFKGISDPVVLVSDNNKKPGFFSKIRPPSTNFFKNKKALGGILTVMLLFAVGIGVYLSQKPTELTPQADNNKAEISIKPTTQTVGVNQEFESEVFLDTKDLTVTAVQAKVNFDPNSLQLIQATAGDFLPTVLSSPQNTANSTFFAVVSNPGKKGSGKIATLRFKAIASASATPTTIEFDQSQTEGASVETLQDNVLTGYFSSNITISNSFSPAPSASASASPTVSPSPSASASAFPAGKGDGNNDGNIDLQDLSVLYSKWSPAINITSNFQLDFNDDNKINSFDRSTLVELLYSLGVIKR